MINGPLITEKRRRLQELCNEKLQPEAHLDCFFSGRWLTKFKRRWGLKHFTCHKKSGDANTDASESVVTYLRVKNKAYVRRDVYNANEWGLFYNLA